MTDEKAPFKATLDDYRWLVSQEAQPWIRRVVEDTREAVAVVQALRRDLSAGRTHLLLELVELRRRAHDKFAEAGRMFFTKVGLEQATDQLVANYKARRFADVGHCFDLCCGIGGDLLALAGRGSSVRTVGVERDRVVALLAAANVREISPEARVVVADATDFPLSKQALPGDCAWHLDPDRRPEGRRTTRLEWHSPALPAVERLIEHCPHGAIKLAPAADVPEGWQDRVELEWISRQRQCRQLVVWLGNLSESPGCRRATLLKADRLDAEPTVYSIVGRPGVSVSVAAEVGRYVFEPDPSVLASDLTGELAVRHELERLAAGSVYLTADQSVDEPLAACFEVDVVLPFDRKRLKRHLAQNGIDRLEIKQRGMSIDPERLRRELRVSGARTADEDSTVLILTMRDDTALAILAKRIR